MGAGTLPSQWGKPNGMPNLMGLWVRATSLGGTPPSSWPEQLPSLRWLDLGTWQDVNFGCREVRRGLSGMPAPVHEAMVCSIP